MQTITLQAPKPVKAQICQPKSQSRVTLVSGLAGISVVAGLVAVVLPVPAIAANDYERCTADLLGAKISSEEAASACSRAFFPRDLSACVSQLSGNTFAPADALNACRQVRRPRDLATCVVDIRREISDSTAADVLDSCRRSLLPTRYSDCVVGLNQAAKLPSAKALDSCIDASAFPREVDPTFLPFTPSGGVNVTPQTGSTTPSVSPTTAPTAVPSPTPSSPAPATQSEPIPQRN
ncbi:hypothetical protein [Stenomitos frigidus]|uniref:Uncharacterized protein n=1 Tax=Stenomitos frigidus ULC18 TaxID=2107698 RepID=A0A2T1E610_9CYAN|nr:hypothetical protein [Stenomitos frigidus]PSB28168.1 hypothetical protein C7B82_15105 [Stenomitos frigidus ULC18]